MIWDIIFMDYEVKFLKKLICIYFFDNSLYYSDWILLRELFVRVICFCFGSFGINI